MTTDDQRRNEFPPVPADSDESVSSGAVENDGMGGEASKNRKEPQDNDPFDISRLRVSQDFAQALGVRKLLTTVPVRKPNRQDYIRVRPGEDYRLETVILELKEDRESFLVEPNLWSKLSGELIVKVLFTCINQQGVLTLWPVRMPGEDGRQDQWNASALEAADFARDRWVRVVANMSLGAYEVIEAGSNLPEPEWPELTLQEILRIAFKGRYITELDHPVIRRLRGEL